jgi:folate-dependent tRNA-U54 methylase TrmFO/GidA
MTSHKKNKFQPMPPNFGLLPELEFKIKDKKLRYKAYQKRSCEVLKEFKESLENYFEKNQIPIEIN